MASSEEPEAAMHEAMSSQYAAWAAYIAENPAFAASFQTQMASMMTEESISAMSQLLTPGGGGSGGARGGGVAGTSGTDGSAAAAAASAASWTGTVEEEEPIYVNAKQYSRILKRRAARALLEESNKMPKRKSFMHQSRHRHAKKRRRGPGGRFLTKAELQAEKVKEEREKEERAKEEREKEENVQNDTSTC